MKDKVLIIPEKWVDANINFRKDALPADTDNLQFIGFLEELKAQFPPKDGTGILKAIEYGCHMRNQAYNRLSADPDDHYWKGQIVAIDAILSILQE